MIDNDAGALISIRGLNVRYGSVHAVRGIDLDVKEKEIVFVIGPSGCGKSTFLRSINLLERPSAGSIRVGSEIQSFGPGGTSSSGRQLALYRSRIGMVFQQFDLFPHLTVLQNITEGPIVVRKVPRHEAEAAARRLLKKVGLLDKADVRPAQLSGGQAQRAAIARALAMEPRVLLLDEITSALDPELVQEVLTVVRELASEGITMILVTHEIGFARDVADRVIMMEEGKIVEQGSAADVLDNPKHDRTRAFLSRFHGQQQSITSNRHPMTPQP